MADESYKWSNVTELAPAAFTKDGRLKQRGPAMVLFYRPSCPWCKKVKADWDKFAESVRPAGVPVGAVSIALYPELRVGFRTVPTMILYKDGVPTLYPSDAPRDWQSMCVWLCSHLDNSRALGFCSTAPRKKCLG